MIYQIAGKIITSIQDGRSITTRAVRNFRASNAQEACMLFSLTYRTIEIEKVKRIGPDHKGPPNDGINYAERDDLRGMIAT